jgi:membrane-associated phospholipid phosphatase
LGRTPLLNRNVLERAILTALAVALFVAGYFGVGLHTSPKSAHDLSTALDARIPFIASSVFVYLAAFPAAFLPLFVVRCPRLFRRTIAAYAAAIVVSVVTFAVYPVTSLGLRVPRSSLDAAGFSTWAVSVLYRLDPPSNLFPSLHLSIALLAGLATFSASRVYGAVALAGLAPIGIAILTVKQHFVLDGVAGIVLAVVLYALVVRPYETTAGSDPAYGRRGPALFCVVVAGAYAAAYAAFRLN